MPDRSKERDEDGALASLDVRRRAWLRRQIAKGVSPLECSKCVVKTTGSLGQAWIVLRAARSLERYANEMGKRA